MVSSVGEQPGQLFTNLWSGTITATNGTMITDSTKAWTPGFLNHRTVYLPATPTRGDRYYYVYTNSANTLDIRHRTIEFNIFPIWRPMVCNWATLTSSAVDFQLRQESKAGGWKRADT